MKLALPQLSITVDMQPPQRQLDIIVVISQRFGLQL